MKLTYLPVFALPLFCVSAGSLGCSDSGVGAQTGGMPSAPAGGANAMGGVPGAAGQVTSSGSPTGGALGTAGAPATTAGSGGMATGTAGTGAGGSAVAGAGTAGSGTAGSGTAGSAGSGVGGAGGGTCTASVDTGKAASGSGPHAVVIETNSATGIKCGTIFRPKTLKAAEKYPILVWGHGSCAQNGLENQAAMAEIASWGYFIIADGTPGGANACQSGQNGKAFLDYITWAIAENAKPCSAYYQSLETTKIAADGFSCGGLMAANVSGDPRFSAIGITSSGLMTPNEALYDKIHTPFKIMNGGSSDIAYANGLRDYEEISSRGKPTLYFSKKSAGHGGDLGQARGDFNRVNLAWLNWQLKGDQGLTGKGFLVGSSCGFCTDSGWDYESANVQ